VIEAIALYEAACPYQGGKDTPLFAAPAANG